VPRSTAIDSTYITIQALDLAQKGALGPTDRAVPGRWTTKIHALTDVVGRPYAPMLTPGNVSDIKAVPAFANMPVACVLAR
jgi:hypothetical protein